MSFFPTYRCDGPTCLEEARAENDSELLLEGWLALTYSDARGDPDEHEDLHGDFCSPACLAGWLDERGES